MIGMDALEVIGSVLGGVGVVAFSLNKSGLLHFGKRKDCGDCHEVVASGSVCSEHTALLDSVAEIRAKVDHQDVKLDRVAEDTAFIRGVLKGWKK